ncbi:probable serine/threonine-protein kinase At1g54610 isoform X2 [Durio zibethinus]|uniref:Probable serine/threonine-protein kinase At1g54610 isoform X2 n=1 Tax=Durio zibethinus TaxID=66656 RepID=A0A6P5Y7B5_DURZI|nr:probable serine/threonine-protein kinase At1g54610 isoform X2 [Durio zibethinus]
MGCVCGKQSKSPSSDPRQRSNTSAPSHPPRASRRRSSDESSTIVSVTDAVDGVVDVKEPEGPRQQPQKARHTGDFSVSIPAPERRRTPPDLNQKGWPSWLMAVAGEAIRDWTPRRANTFEKLEKVKCYMKQLLSGLEHCHKHGVLHRDIKGSNLLIDNEGILKIADFGLASFCDPEQKKPLTSRVVTLWYRPPELLLGATYYGVGVDLWSAGCILAELLSGKPIMPGRTEVEQLHKIFKLCGSPSEEYWKKSKLPNATLFKPQQPYKRCIAETFKDFPSSSLPLIETLLSIDPEERSTATAALNSEFFTTEPFACEPSSLPRYPPSKEMDVKLRDEEARRQRGLASKVNAVDGARRTKGRERFSRAVPAPEANAEIQANLDKWRVMTQTNAKSKSEKFPPPHQDGAVGHPVDASHKGPVSFGGTDTSFSSSVFPKSSGSAKSSGPTGGPSRRRKTSKDPQRAPSRKFIPGFKPSSLGLSMDLLFRGKSEVFRSQN